MSETMLFEAEQPEFLRDPPPRERHYTIISVDDHLVEPPDMFDGRLEARFADRAPRVITLDPGSEITRPGLRSIVAGDDHQAWVYEDKLYVQPGLNAVVGHRDNARHRMEPTSFSEMRPGCYDIHARVRDMDINGVWASANFPSQLSGFCGSVFSRSRDAELGYAVTQAWNDWLREAWWSPYPERIIPLGITWLANPALGAAEIERNAARGFTAVTLPELPERVGYPGVHTGYWDPILAACEETETVICLHVGSSGIVELARSDNAFEQAITLFPAMSLMACIEWLWSGALQRFPRLQIVLSEGGIGWVPMLFDRLDYIGEHALSSGAAEWAGDLTPSEVLRRNFSFCTLDDPSILPVIHRIGVDNVMVEVDYPHADSTWPDTQELLHRRFEEHADILSAPDIRKLTHENAARVFRHPLPVV